MEPDALPSSLIGAVVFFGLIAMIAWLVIREAVRIVLKPALVVALLALVAVWAGFLEGFLFKYATLAERLLMGLAAVFLMLPIDHLFTFLTPYEGEYHYQAYVVGLALLGLAVALQRMRRVPKTAVRAA